MYRNREAVFYHEEVLRDIGKRQNNEKYTKR